MKTADLIVTQYMFRRTGIDETAAIELTTICCLLTNSVFCIPDNK